jgi:glycosyltransferase involved in cell wall biosynthesis
MSERLPGVPAATRPPAAAEDAPFVTVVLIASRHRRFVEEAIRSVLDQKVDAGGFELLVVLDYTDPALVARLEASGARWTQVPPGDIGPAIAAGIRESRGLVVAFLDDDDRFRPGKLEAIRRAFVRYPELGFYRNGYVPIDAEGCPLPDHPIRRRERTALSRLGTRYLPGPSVVRELHALPPLGIDFNSSSMAVRRDLLARFAARLDLNGFRLLDALLFFAVLDSERGLLLDPEERTEYRLHANNSSIAQGAVGNPMEGAAAFARIAAPSYRKLAEASRAAGPEVAREAEGLLAVQQAYFDLRRVGVPRATYLAHLRRVRHLRGAYLVRCERRLPLALFLFTLSPGLGRYLYRRELAQRERRARPVTGSLRAS